MSPYSRITHVAVHLPDGRQTSEAIEDRLREHSPALRVPPGLLRRMYGLEDPVVADDGILPSDLASRAALKALTAAGVEPGEADLLLFASVSADVQEPANAHIVAAKTGLSCPVLDISNACNSVLNALEVADALIRCSRYRRVLVACGETLSRLSRWTITSRQEVRTALASMTGGDMGAALIVEASAEPGIIASTFMANSASWPAATLFNPYQATGLPQGLDIDSGQLLASFLGLDTRAVQWLKEHDTDPAELGLVCVHQPSVPFVRSVSERLGIRPDTVVPTFPPGQRGRRHPPSGTLPRRRTGPPASRHEDRTVRYGQRRQRRRHADQAVMLINWTASGPRDL